MRSFQICRPNRRPSMESTLSLTRTRAHADQRRAARSHGDCPDLLPVLVLFRTIFATDDVRAEEGASQVPHHIQLSDETPIPYRLGPARLQQV